MSKIHLTYRKAFQAGYRGCQFDSQLELRYALSIEDDYYFLRAHFPIWYNPETLIPTSYLTDNTRNYTPDFLIRHKQTGEAFLIEVKPRDWQFEQQNQVRSIVARNYIALQRLDWKFLIVYDDQIFLSPDKQQRFEGICNRKFAFAETMRFQQLQLKFNRTAKKFYRSIPTNNGFTDRDYIRLVKYGNSSACFS